MRAGPVNTGPLFRAIKQFPCTHGIMFLLFSIVRRRRENAGGSKDSRDGENQGGERVRG